MSLKAKLILTIVLVALISSGAALFVFTRHQGDAKTIASQPVNKSRFSFDSTKAEGQWNAQSAYPAENVTKDYVGNPAELPTVSMTIHRNSTSHDKSDNCFVSYSYYQGQAIDITVKLKEKSQQATQKSSTLSLEATATQTLHIAVNHKTEDVILYQYNLAGAYPGEAMRGIEFGYINTKKGYIEVQGNCMKADQLGNTLPVLQAVAFDE